MAEKGAVGLSSFEILRKERQGREEQQSDVQRPWMSPCKPTLETLEFENRPWTPQLP
jgi:hypothetical protein